MKSNLIVLLLSILLVQESKTNCAEWKQLESKCGSYCFKALGPVLGYTQELQSKVNDFKCERQSLDKLEDAEELIQRHLNVHDRKVEQKLEDLRGIIEIKLLKLTKSNTKQIRDFMEKFQYIESQLEKIVAFNTKLTQNYEKQSNLNEANLQKENSDFLAKFQNIEQQLNIQFEVQAEKLDQKLENQSNVTKSLVQTQVDNLKATINHMELSENMKIIQEQFKSHQKTLETQTNNTQTQIENIKNQLQDNIDVQGKRWEQYRKIGSKYYYIEESKRFNWFVAFHKCLRLGGHLASIKNVSEFTAIVAELQPKKHYWLDFNDLAADRYLSAATGLDATYFNWHKDCPTRRNFEHCGVFLFLDNKHLMCDNKCYRENFFICEPYYQ